MNKFCLALFTLLLFPCLDAHAQQIITLKDGTVLKGRLSGIAGDSYLIETKNIGTVTIKTADLQSITETASAPVPNTANPMPLQGTMPAGMMNNQMNPQAIASQMQMNPGIAQLSQNLMSDPEVMAMVKEIMADPELMKMIQDPNLMQGVLSMDPSQMQGPAVKSLQENPKMQQLMQKMQQKMQQNPGMLNSVAYPK